MVDSVPFSQEELHYEGDSGDPRKKISRGGPSHLAPTGFPRLVLFGAEFFFIREISEKSAQQPPYLLLYNILDFGCTRPHIRLSVVP